MKLSSNSFVFIPCQTLAAGTLPRTPTAILVTTEGSLRSSMTGAMLTEGGKKMRQRWTEKLPPQDSYVFLLFLY